MSALDLPRFVALVTEDGMHWLHTEHPCLILRLTKVDDGGYETEAFPYDDTTTEPEVRAVVEAFLPWLQTWRPRPSERPV